MHPVCDGKGRFRMIPFAILSGKIKTKTDEKEIRLLELSPNYFTFRLLKEQARLEKELARSKGMLSNEKFLSKAPEAKVQEEKDKLAGYEQMMAQVKERLAQMK